LASNVAAFTISYDEKYNAWAGIQPTNIVCTPLHNLDMPTVFTTTASEDAVVEFLMAVSAPPLSKANG
jgi:hypothetical protein